MDGVLAPAVADTSRSWGLGVDEKTGDVKVLFGGDEVEGRLAVVIYTDVDC